MHRQHEQVRDRLVALRLKVMLAIQNVSKPRRSSCLAIASALSNTVTSSPLLKRRALTAAPL
jgi:hypothetical protein